MSKTLTLPIFISFLFIGCATTGGRVAQDSNLGPELPRLRANSDKRILASGTGNVAWRSPKRSIAAAGVLAIEFPTRLRLEVQDPVGGMIALLVLNDGKFWSYLEEKGEAVTGATTDPGFRSLVPLPLGADDLVRVLLAKPHLPLDRWTYASSHSGKIVREDGRVDFFDWDPSQEQLRQWRLDLGKGQFVRADYSDYRIRGGIAYPQRIELRWLEGERERFRLVWTWSDLATYLPQVSNIFAVPPAWGENVRTRRL